MTTPLKPDISIRTLSEHFPFDLGGNILAIFGQDANRVVVGDGDPFDARQPRAPATQSPLGPFGFEGAHYRQTLRPFVDGIRSKALRPFGVQKMISRIQQYSADGSQ